MSTTKMILIQHFKTVTPSQSLADVLFLWLLCVCWSFGGGVCEAAPLEDLITRLPDFVGPTPTLHYSGYLNATAGCNTKVNGAYCQLHYWFALAEGNNPFEKPVVLWLNGGPGASSIIGLLTENGPLLLNATGNGFMINPYSWTKFVNLLVIETPVGVGYSYCEIQKTHSNKTCHNTDTYTATANHAALHDFFVNKFPELQKNDFFITGESYAGVYIPTLCKEILNYNDANAANDSNDSSSISINLVGIAVGDPCTDNTAQHDSMDALWYSNKYGLVDEQIYDVLWNKCYMRFPIIHNVVIPKMLKNRHLQENNGHQNNECILAMRKFLLSTSHALLHKGIPDLYIDAYSLYDPYTTKESQDLARYMMSADVRAALHVQDAPVISTWPKPDDFDYTKQYDACNVNARVGAESMIDFYRDICPRLKITFIYNGNADPCVSYEGTRIAVKRIGLNELNGGSYRPWFYNHTAVIDKHLFMEKPPLFGPNLLAHSVGFQMGGEVINYQHGLSFLTIHGSGHLVPQSRPQAALHMLEKLLQKGKTLLSPLLPSNETLIHLKDDEFQKVMATWTESAMAEPYVLKN